MILSKVRTYIENSIKSVDSKFKLIDSPFNIDVSENKFDKSYHIKYDVVSTDQYDTHVKDSITAEVTLSFKSFKDGIDKYDYAMDLVNDIRMKCISISNIESYKNTDTNMILSCNSLSQIGEQLPNNNKQIIIVLTLELSVNQSIC